jgi:hypothetical protein
MVMHQRTIVNKITKHRFFYYEEPLYAGEQPFTSEIGRIVIAEKKVGKNTYTGVTFWLHEFENNWLLGLYSPQWFLARKPSLLPDLAVKFLTRQCSISSPTGLSHTIIQEYQLEDWSTIVDRSLARSVIICRKCSASTMEEAQSVLKAPPITKREFVDHVIPFVDRSTQIPFNGLEFYYRGVRGIIRFKGDITCFDFHELLLFANDNNNDFSKDEYKLIKLICKKLGCSAFDSSGELI